jgi:hypothetical protein
MYNFIHCGVDVLHHDIVCTHIISYNNNNNNNIYTYERSVNFGRRCRVPPLYYVRVLCSCASTYPLRRRKSNPHAVTMVRVINMRAPVRAAIRIYNIYIILYITLQYTDIYMWRLNNAHIMSVFNNVSLCIMWYRTAKYAIRLRTPFARLSGVPPTSPEGLLRACTPLALNHCPRRRHFLTPAAGAVQHL